MHFVALYEQGCPVIVGMLLDKLGPVRRSVDGPKYCN
jgi:hypothetical protein